MYLLIQNEGVAPIEAFTVLGDSGTRHRTNAGLIGQFGSGNKHGINLLLRANIPFTIYSGNTKLTFFVEVKYITEADGSTRESYPVKCRLSGDSNKTIECGWTLDFGAIDWTKPSMALREFVSNAIDCSTIMGTEAVIRPEHNVRAKAGTTRIFVDLTNPDVAQFHRELGRHFLHLSGDPTQVGETFLKKNPETAGPIIYREGVKVLELPSTHRAMYDYNFRANEIAIDECRNSSEYALRGAISRLYNSASPEVLVELFTEMEKETLYEACLDEFYLGYLDDDRVKSNWQGAWSTFAGDGVVANEVMGSSVMSEHVRSKGHSVRILKSENFVKVAQKMGVPSIVTVIGEAAENGSVPVETTQEAIDAVDIVWNWCVRASMTKGKAKPKVQCFKQLMDAGGECFGYHVAGGDTVYLRDNLAGKIAQKVALEEVAHYITGSTDMSRDFQAFAFDMVVELNHI